MNILRVALLSFMACVFLSAQAQDVAEQKKEIAKIKTSNKYICAERTEASQQEAIDRATEELHEKINSYVAQEKRFKGADKVVTINTNYSIDQITMPRANMFRAFLYVKKKDIIPVNNATVEDAPEEVKTTQEETASEPLVQVDEMTRSVMDDLLTCQTTTQIRKKLVTLKDEGKIISYNKLSQIQKKEECVMVVFDKDGMVKAILSDGETRLNAKTNLTDALGNYKGCGAIGIKVKK